MSVLNLCVSRNTPSPPYRGQVTQTAVALVVKQKITQLLGYLLYHINTQTQTHRHTQRHTENQASSRDSHVSLLDNLSPLGTSDRFWLIEARAINTHIHKRVEILTYTLISSAPPSTAQPQWFIIVVSVTNENTIYTIRVCTYSIFACVYCFGWVGSEVN